MHCFGFSTSDPGQRVAHSPIPLHCDPQYLRRRLTHCRIPRDVLEERKGEGGVLGPKSLCIKNGPIRFSQWQISFFPTMVTLVWREGGGVQRGGGEVTPPPTVYGHSNTSLRIPTGQHRTHTWQKLPWTWTRCGTLRCTSRCSHTPTKSPQTPAAPPGNRQGSRCTTSCHC